MGSSASAASIAIVFVFIVCFRLRAILVLVVVGQAHRLPLYGAASQAERPPYKILCSFLMEISLSGNRHQGYFFGRIAHAKRRAGLRIFPLHRLTLARAQPAHWFVP